MFLLFYSDSVQAAVDTRHTLVPVKRERRNSTSSQHSTNSNLSHASSSSRHKRTKSSGVNKAPKVEVSQDLRACSTQVTSLQSADLYNRSASPALSTKPSPVSIHTEVANAHPLFFGEA